MVFFSSASSAFSLSREEERRRALQGGVYGGVNGGDLYWGGLYGVVGGAFNISDGEIGGVFVMLVLMVVFKVHCWVRCWMFITL